MFFLLCPRLYIIRRRRSNVHFNALNFFVRVRILASSPTIIRPMGCVFSVVDEEMRYLYMSNALLRPRPICEKIMHVTSGCSPLTRRDRLFSCSAPASSMIVENRIAECLCPLASDMGALSYISECSNDACPMRIALTFAAAPVVRFLSIKIAMRFMQPPSLKSRFGF